MNPSLEDETFWTFTWICHRVIQTQHLHRRIGLND